VNDALWLPRRGPTLFLASPECSPSTGTGIIVNLGIGATKFLPSPRTSSARHEVDRPPSDGAHIHTGSHVGSSGGADDLVWRRLCRLVWHQDVLARDCWRMATACGSPRMRALCQQTGPARMAQPTMARCPQTCPERPHEGDGRVGEACYACKQRSACDVGAHGERRISSAPSAGGAGVERLTAGNENMGLATSTPTIAA